MEVAKVLTRWALSLEPIAQWCGLERRRSRPQVWDLCPGATLRIDRVPGVRRVLDKVFWQAKTAWLLAASRPNTTGPATSPTAACGWRDNEPP